MTTTTKKLDTLLKILKNTNNKSTKNYYKLFKIYVKRKNKRKMYTNNNNNKITKLLHSDSICMQVSVCICKYL